MESDKEYYYWNKGDKFVLTEHFNSTEFDCHCKLDTCLKQRASKLLLSKLESIRADLEQPLKVNSGHRCTGYQQQLRDRGYETAKGLSQHELGNAADISASSMGELLLQCRRFFMCIGAAEHFVHVDTRADKQRFWSYKSNVP